MAKDEGWGRRLRSARRAYVEHHDGELTYAAIGKRLGERLNRPAFKHSTVRAWFVDGQEPDSFEVAIALAGVLEADAGYLITGDAKTPSIEGVSGHHSYTQEEREADARQAAKDRAALGKRGPKRNAG